MCGFLIKGWPLNRRVLSIEYQSFVIFLKIFLICFVWFLFNLMIGWSLKESYSSNFRGNHVFLKVTCACNIVFLMWIWLTSWKFYLLFTFFYHIIKCYYIGRVIFRWYHLLLKTHIHSMWICFLFLFIFINVCKFLL